MTISHPRLRLLAASLVGLVCQTGCVATFVDQRAPAGEEKSQWLDYYLVGLVGHERVDVRDLCPTGRARQVEVGGNLLTTGLSVVTLGIYTPRKATIVCARQVPPAAASRTHAQAGAQQETRR